MKLWSYSREYHLTPRGWMEGTCILCDKVQGKEVIRPGATVITMVGHKDSQSTPNSAMTWEKTWVCPTTPKEDIDKLYEYFGESPL